MKPLSLSLSWLPRSTVSASLRLLLLAIPIAAYAADESTTTSPPGGQAKDAPPGDAAEATKPSPPQDVPPKKTQYDQLPLPQLLSKANSGNAIAQFELASRFNYGRGMPRDSNQALIWLRKSAAAGNMDAARVLSVKLFNGFDIPPDHVEAMYWAKMLADKGDLPGQFMLANLYANGEGAPRDLIQAYKWYAIAAVGERPGKDTEPPRQDLLDSAVEQRDKIASLLTEDEEREAQKQASDWWLNKYAPAPQAAKAKPASKSRKTKPRKTVSKRGGN